MWSVVYQEIDHRRRDVHTKGKAFQRVKLTLYRKDRRKRKAPLSVAFLEPNGTQTRVTHKKADKNRLIKCGYASRWVNERCL